MDDTQDQQVGGACAASNPENAPSDHHESDESNPASNPESNPESNAESNAESTAESTTESSDSDQGIVVSGAEGGSDGNEITGKIVHSREDFDADPNVNLTIGSYKIIARNEASTLYQCVNNLSPGMVHTCSLVHPEDKFKFMAAHERVRGNPLVNQIHEVVTEGGKSLVIYQSNYGDLHHYCLINKSLPEPEVAKYFKQILTIMIDVHRVGIIPRELKLKKFVFVDEERTKLVLDTWEDSILLTDPEDDAIIDKCGCPPYVSPEVLTCKEVCYSGRRANYWTLGVILYTMLTNRYPFYNSHNVSSMFNRISKGIFTIPEYVSPWAQTLINAFICVKPELRITPEEALKHEWIRMHCDPNYIAPPTSEGEESNGDAFPVLLPDHLAPRLARANIDSPQSFILP